MTATRLPVPTEHQEQAMLIKWCRTQHVRYPELKWIFSIPNQGGAGYGAMMRGRKMKAEGLQPGYPDIGLDHARGGYHGFRGELKRREGGRTSPEQKAWGEHLAAEGYYVVLCEGWEAMSRALLRYITMPRSA